MANKISESVDHAEAIDLALKKASAINCLMAYAAIEGALNLGEELIFASQVVSSLIDDAMENVAILADRKQEKTA